MASKSNQRKNRRVDCFAPARAEGPRGPMSGLCRNLSRGGMFFLGARLPVGQSIDLSVELPQLGAIQATGEVRYHHAYPDGGGMGIRFTRMAQEDLQRIQRFVEG